MVSRGALSFTIASGTFRADIEAILRNAAVAEMFTKIIGSDEVPAIKPAPDIFFAMLDAIRQEPYECLVIEDAEKGMQAAIAAEIPVIVVKTKETRSFDFSAANLVVESHEELRALVHAHYA